MDCYVTLVYQYSWQILSSLLRVLKLGRLFILTVTASSLVVVLFRGDEVYTFHGC